MKNVFLFLFFLFFVKVVQAQLFYKNDSVRRSPIIHVGLGAYSGSYMLNPNSGSLTYNNKPGVDQGIIARVCLDVFKNITISSDLRYSLQSSMVDISNDKYSEHFYLQLSGWQIPFTIKYSFISKKQIEMLGIYAGMSYNRMLYETSSDYFIRAQGFIGTTGGGATINGIEKTYYSWLIGLSKKLDLKQGFSLVLFNEYEYKDKAFQSGASVTDINSGVHESYVSVFNSSSIRLGVILIY
jgi:hypothetical protein